MKKVKVCEMSSDPWFEMFDKVYEEDLYIIKNIYLIRKIKIVKMEIYKTVIRSYIRITIS